MQRAQISTNIYEFHLSRVVIDTTINELKTFVCDLLRTVVTM